MPESCAPPAAMPAEALGIDLADQPKPISSRTTSQRTTPETFLAMAELMTRRQGGRTLLRELWAAFPEARRWETFLAVSIAIALLEADLLIAELELQALQGTRRP